MSIVILYKFTVIFMLICNKIKGLIYQRKQNVRMISRKMGNSADSLNSLLVKDGNIKLDTIESILKALDMELILCAKDTQTGEVYTLCGEYPNGIDVEPYEKRAKEPSWKNLLEKE